MEKPAPRSPAAPAAPADLHEFLGATPARIRAEVVADGADPLMEIQAMRRLGQVMERRYADTPKPAKAAPREMEFLAPSWQSKQFQRFDEAVAAGIPAWEDASKMPTPRSFLDILEHSDPGCVIWARVSGWSMKDVGINDGDTILVDTSAEARDGQIVLAHIAGRGQVVKRLRIHGDKAILESANADFAPIEIHEASDLKIHGVVLGRAGKI